MTAKPLEPAEVQALLNQGALLVDVREADEHARERIPGAVNRPLAGLASLDVGDRPVIYHCRSGMRTQAHAGPLAEAAGGNDCYILAGGIDAWRKAGLPTAIDRHQPLEVMRQVQLIAGALVLAGVILGWFVAPGFTLLSGMIGAGLMMAGATGWCGLARLLLRMPWNRRAVQG